MAEKCHSILRGKNGRLAAHVASVSADLKAGHVIPEHMHPEDQLLFASKGVMTVRTKQGVWVVPPMRAVWIPANTPHSVSMSGQVSMRTLYLEPKLGHGLPGRCFVINVAPLLKELILHACRYGRLNKKVGTQRRIIEMVVDQLNEAESIPLQLPQVSDSRALRVAQTLFVDPGDRRTLRKLCKDSGASKRTIERIFLDETKMTFGKWRQQLRLLRAMEVLASGEKVSFAAAEAGYDSTSAFISMFRKQLGTTPRRYLKN
jgi:AraC-like DNA-binding protein